MKRQAGFSLIGALFMIVVLAFIALFAVRIGGSSEQDATTALMEARALAAARAGIEYGAYRAAVLGTCAVPFTVNVPMTQGTLTGFTVRVSCSGTDWGSNVRSYDITARAIRGTYGTPDYVARTITRRVTTGTT